MEIEYNSPEGLDRELRELKNNDLLFYYGMKDYWTDMLVSLCRKSNTQDEELTKNVIAMAVFAEWHIYIYKLFLYFKKGISNGIFEANKPISQCNIPLEWLKYRTKFYKGIKIEYDKTQINVVDDSQKSYTVLQYANDFENFTILDIAAALHSGVCLSSKHFINEVMDLGATKFHKFEYEIPYIDIAPSIPKFSTQSFRHLDIIADATTSQRMIYRDSNRSGGIYNVFTGERVSSVDDTFYIDDFK